VIDKDLFTRNCLGVPSIVRLIRNYNQLLSITSVCVVVTIIKSQGLTLGVIIIVIVIMFCSQLHKSEIDLVLNKTLCNLIL